jgi:sec-independent protein translocase protein TatC
MFDIGWMELLLIGIVALIVVGPKDLPKLFRTVGNVMGKARGMAREFQRSMEQAADESGLREATRDLNSINKLNLNAPTKSARKYAEGLVTGAKKAEAARSGRQRQAADAPGPERGAAAAPAAARTRARRRRAARATRAPSVSRAATGGRQPGMADEGPSRRHRRHDGAARRASRRAAHPADPLGPRLRGLHDRVLRGGAADLQLPRRAADRRPPGFRPAPEMIYTGLQQGFMVQVRISIFGGFVMAFPIIAHQLWRFVAPGLYRQREAGLPALPDLLAVLFALGGGLRLLCRAAARLPLLPRLPAVRHGLRGHRGVAAQQGEELTIQFLGTINEYLGLTMKFIVAFGLCFQLPVLLTLMGKAGLVSARGLGDVRKYAMVGILVLAAVVTPPDVITQVILFVVVYGLYEISILLVRIVERGARTSSRPRASGTRKPRLDEREAVTEGQASAAALARIADALERLSPPPGSSPDLDAADAFVWHVDARPARPRPPRRARRDRAPRRHRPGARHAARQHAPVRPRLSGEQRAALGRARHGQVLPRQGRPCRGRPRPARPGQADRAPPRGPALDRPAPRRSSGRARTASSCSATTSPSTRTTATTSR